MRCRYVLLLVLWILWSELAGVEKTDWSYIYSFEKRQVCDLTAEMAASRAKQKNLEKVLDSGRVHVTYYIGGIVTERWTYTLTYHCVPDTVDPRAK
jgi:hypothetical protein